MHRLHPDLTASLQGSLVVDVGGDDGAVTRPTRTLQLSQSPTVLLLTFLLTLANSSTLLPSVVRKGLDNVAATNSLDTTDGFDNVNNASGNDTSGNDTSSSDTSGSDTSGNDTSSDDTSSDDTSGNVVIDLAGF